MLWRKLDRGDEKIKVHDSPRSTPCPFDGDINIIQKDNDHQPGGDSFFSKMHILQVPELHQDDVNSLLAKMVREERIRDDRSSLLCTLMLQELLVMCGRVCLTSHRG